MDRRLVRRGGWPSRFVFGRAEHYTARVCELCSTGFLAALDGERRDELLALADWHGRLRGAIAAASPTCAAIGLDASALARAMGASLQGHGGQAVDWFEHLHPEELALACACAAGLAQALARFERQYEEDIAKLVRRFSRPDLPAEDLRQLLLRKLFVREAPDAPPRIACYTGQGFLQNWLRVTAARTFIDALRAREAMPESPTEDDLLERMLLPGANPELELARRQGAACFKAAVAEAVAALERSQRLLLKQHLVARLSIDQLAALHAVHRATAARRVAAARAALVKHARAALMRRLRVDEAQLDSLIGLLESKLDGSLERLLDVP